MATTSSCLREVTGDTGLKFPICEQPTKKRAEYLRTRNERQPELVGVAVTQPTEDGVLVSSQFDRHPDQLGLLRFDGHGDTLLRSCVDADRHAALPLEPVDDM